MNRITDGGYVNESFLKIATYGRNEEALRFKSTFVYFAVLVDLEAIATQ